MKKIICRFFSNFLRSLVRHWLKFWYAKSFEKSLQQRIRQFFFFIFAFQKKKEKEKQNKKIICRFFSNFLRSLVRHRLKFWYAKSFEKSLQQRIREFFFSFSRRDFFEFSKCRFLSYIVTKLLALWWERTESINSRCRAENRNILGRKMQKSKCENSSCRRLYLFYAKKKNIQEAPNTPRTLSNPRRGRKQGCQHAIWCTTRRRPCQMQKIAENRQRHRHQTNQT